MSQGFTREQETIEHLDSIIIGLKKLIQVANTPSYTNEIGMVKITPGASAGTLPISGSVAFTTAGSGLVDQTFSIYFQSKIMINTRNSQLITR